MAHPAGVDGRGPVVLAVHGITGNHRCWSYLADSLATCGSSRRTCVAAAVRRPSGALRMAALGRLGARLDALEVERVVLVGHSMGGFVATVLAHRHPERVSSVVLVDGGLPVTSEVPEDPRTSPANVTAPLVRRLGAAFRSEAEAVAFWRRHPAFAGSWSQSLPTCRYDLGGERRARSRAAVAAVCSDSDDILVGSAVRAALDELVTRPGGSPHTLGSWAPPGSTTPSWSCTEADHPAIEHVPVPGVNHYTRGPEPCGFRRGRRRRAASSRPEHTQRPR